MNARNASSPVTSRSGSPVPCGVISWATPWACRTSPGCLADRQGPLRRDRDPRSAARNVERRRRTDARPAGFAADSRLRCRGPGATRDHLVSRRCIHAGWRRPLRHGRDDVGGTDRDRSGTPAADAGPSDEFDNGNGSLMRILPIALVERDADDATVVDHAMRASRVTHGHPRSQVACALYVLVAVRLLAGGAIERRLSQTRDPRFVRRSRTRLTTSRRSIISRRTGHELGAAACGTPSGRRGTRSKARTRIARPSSAPSRTATTPTRLPRSPVALPASTGVSTASPRSGSRACAAARLSSL